MATWVMMWVASHINDIVKLCIGKSTVVTCLPSMISNITGGLGSKLGVGAKELLLIGFFMY